MDCEKFDQHVIDALYEELDELTAAALKRHTEGCTRCAPIFAGLKNAREAATLPLEEPSADLEARILAAEKAALRRAPWYFKVVRGAAWAGSLAMRPQLAMAALFMLVVGSSLLLLRARPGTLGAPVQVTQRGEPGPTADTGQQGARTRDVRPAEAQKVAGGAPRDEGSYGREDRAEKDKAGERTAAPEAPAAVGQTGSAAPAAAPPSPVATAESLTANMTPAAGDLAAARRAKAESGCTVALQQFDSIAKNYPASDEANVAKQEAQACKNELSKAPQPAKPADASKTTPPAASH
jgi:hypothetical protein